VSSHDERHVSAYGLRASGYERGPRGMLHGEIVRRVAMLTAGETPREARVLDVGCGTGALVRVLGGLRPELRELVGVDPAPEMVAVAEAARTDPRMRFEVAAAERLPHPDGSFDVVVSSASFSHWRDQDAGLAECARVLAPGGVLVLADVFTRRRLPVGVFGPGGAAQSVQRATGSLRSAGFVRLRWRRVFGGVVRAAVANTRG
jgi:ubiquinone/menaquinone biosynthesis C-methylase UbiE